PGPRLSKTLALESYHLRGVAIIHHRRREFGGIGHPQVVVVPPGNAIGLAAAVPAQIAFVLGSLGTGVARDQGPFETKLPSAPGARRGQHREAVIAQIGVRTAAGGSPFVFGLPAESGLAPARAVPDEMVPEIPREIQGGPFRGEVGRVENLA